MSNAIGPIGSIMEFFRGPTVASQVPGAPGANQQQQQPNSALQNPTVPSAATPQSDGKGPGAFPAAGAGDKSPLDGFQELWKIDPANKSQLPDLVQKFNMDPAKLAEVASKVDFSKAVNPELAAKALSGDATAFAQVLSAVAQNSLVQSTNVAGRMMETQQTKFVEALQAHIPNILKQHSTTAAVQDSSAVFQNPAVSPVVTALQTQILAKNPNATPQEVSQQVSAYMTGLAEALITGSGRVITDAPTAQAGGRKKEQDWSQYFLGTSS
jgi:hypothetical protein